jgi:predicted dehydrogenase/threonine dehydrogenase-like Zn-dependent dehydrogenase
MLLNFGKAGWIGKVRQQPEKVQTVIEKARTDGLAATLEAVRRKLEQPIVLGYSNVGTVVETGPGVTGFAPGDRVASNGSHSEMTIVAQNLCAKIPDRVTDEAAAFTVLGAIALQGVRLAQPTLGESVAVTGLGLIGLLTVQLLRANGCRVLGIDLDPVRLELAGRCGAETVDLSRTTDPVAAGEQFSRYRGLDAVIISAATHSSEPVHHAALMCRNRGRIVLTGVTGLQLSRDDFYKKELTLQVSCSYGPGRYDPAYESGADYPTGYVRWTAQRNFEAVLDMIALGELDVVPLITHRFGFDHADSAYEVLESGAGSLGILLRYPPEGQKPTPHLLSRTMEIDGAGGQKQQARAVPAVGMIGAGQYASSSLLPGLKASGSRLVTIVSNGGSSAAHWGRKYAFQAAATDVEAVLGDTSIDAVVIATRHDIHARLVCDALKAGKHVFVEKPLCTTIEELEQIEALYNSLKRSSAAPLLMVGFNRRFAPQIVRIKEVLSSAPGEKTMIITVNAGSLPADHWTQDHHLGGGRIIGEACHFVDLLRFLADAPILRTSVSCPLRTNRAVSVDTATITLEFADGSVGTVHYFANGHKSFPKESMNVFCGGRVLELHNFLRLRGYGWPRFRQMNLWRQDKGNRACIVQFIDAVRTGADSPIPFEQLMEVTRVTIQLAADAQAVMSQSKI